LFVGEMQRSMSALQCHWSGQSVSLAQWM